MQDLTLLRRYYKNKTELEATKNRLTRLSMFHLVDIQIDTTSSVSQLQLLEAEVGNQQAASITSPGGPCTPNES